MSSSSPSRNHQSRTVPSSSNPGSANTGDDNLRHTTSHPTLLEPPFSYADRPSSPRHHSTSSPSNTRSTTRPRHSGVPSTIPATPPHHDSVPALWPDDDDIILPRLRPDDIADLFGWTADDLTGFYSSDGRHSLSDFANQDFSSPSTYPSFTGGSHGSLSDVDASAHNFAHSPPATTRNGSGRPPCNSLSASTSSTDLSAANHQLSFAANASQSSASSSLPRTDYLFPSLAPANMPPTTRRQSMVGRPNATADDGHVNKRQRTTERGRAPKENGSHARVKTVSSDNPFDEADDEDPSLAKREDEEEPLVVDLTDPNTAIENLKVSPEPKEDTRVKLSAFQCVICMDNVTTLTVTHCGHLFCAQCLHSSLNVDTLNKGKCPMCRTKIDMKARESYGPKTKGTWPLELKLMTSNRKGKRKAGALS